MSLPLKGMPSDRLQLGMAHSWWDSAPQEGAVSCQGAGRQPPWLKHRRLLEEGGLPDPWAGSGCFGRRVGEHGSRRESRCESPERSCLQQLPSKVPPRQNSVPFHLDSVSFLRQVGLRGGCSVGCPESWAGSPSLHPGLMSCATQAEGGMLLPLHA